MTFVSVKVKQRGYAVDVKVFLFVFLWFPLFQNKSISDNFCFVGQFVCFSHLYSCLYLQAR